MGATAAVITWDAVAVVVLALAVMVYGTCIFAITSLRTPDEYIGRIVVAAFSSAFVFSTALLVLVT